MLSHPKQKKLHPLQQELLELLQKHQDDPLTIRELQEGAHISSPSVVHHHIKQLEKKGFLRRNPLNSHDYQILAESPDRAIAYLNLYGLASCGPESSILDGNPLDKIPIASKILGFSSDQAFMIKAKGDSMTPKINDGDLVIVKKTTDADNGQIIVCINNGEAFIKQLSKTEDAVLLKSLNPKYEPFLAKSDFRVEGIVRGIYSYGI